MSTSFSEICLWDAISGTRRQMLETGASFGCPPATFSPDGRTLAFSTTGGIIVLWDMTGNMCRLKLDEGGPLITLLTFSPDGNTIATIAMDNIICVWDAKSGTLQQTLHGTKGGVHEVLFSPDGRILASIGYDSIIHIWNTENWSHLYTTKWENLRIVTATFSPNSQTLVLAFESEIHLWGISSRISEQTILMSCGLAVAIALSPNGEILATGSHNGFVRLWDIPTGIQRNVIRVGDSLTKLAFSPDGRYLETDRGLLLANIDVNTSHCANEDQGLDVSSVITHEDRESDVGSDASSSGTFDTKQLSRLSFLVDSEWVVRDGQPILWLPLDYRATSVSFRDGTVVLGHESGGVTFLRFGSEAQIPDQSLLVNRRR